MGPKGGSVRAPLRKKQLAEIERRNKILAKSLCNVKSTYTRKDFVPKSMSIRKKMRQNRSLFVKRKNRVGSPTKSPLRSPKKLNASKSEPTLSTVLAEQAVLSDKADDKASPKA